MTTLTRSQKLMYLFCEYLWNTQKNKMCKIVIIVFNYLETFWFKWVCLSRLSQDNLQHYYAFNSNTHDLMKNLRKAEKKEMLNPSRSNQQGWMLFNYMFFHYCNYIVYVGLLVHFWLFLSILSSAVISKVATLLIYVLFSEICENVLLFVFYQSLFKLIMF